jgi:nucleoside permease NupC
MILCFLKMLLAIIILYLDYLQKILKGFSKRIAKIIKRCKYGPKCQIKEKQAFILIHMTKIFHWFKF